jgi:hypothetical protein
MNKKFQITNHKLQIGSNDQNYNDSNKKNIIILFSHCLPVRQTGNLEFIWDLELGAWDLFNRDLYN